MKISLVSDLHLEYGYQELPGGEVLILAGDICEARDFKKEFHSTRLLDSKPGSYKWYDFFYTECAKYNRVFYVMGNHEHYHGRFDKTQFELEAILPKNVRMLNDTCEEYNGVLFIGSTLWTDCDRNNPLTIHTVKYGMNDYKLIKNHYLNKDVYYKLTPEYTISVHRNSLKYFDQVLKENPNKPAVVISHHAPSHLSIHERYRGQGLNGGYVSDLSEFILDHENIRFWVHGHNHDSFDYKIGETQVFANPRGYIGYDLNPSFDPGFSFDLER